jgi:hypothetical protein
MTTTEFALIDLTTLKAEDLKKLAKDHKVKNWWLLKKTDLVAALAEIQAEVKEEEHLTSDDIDDLVSQVQKELGLDKEVPQEENPLVPMPGTQDPNWGEKAAGKASKKAKTPKAPKVEKDQDNLVTIKELAAEFNMKGTKARRLLRNESALRPFGSNRWEWDKVLHTEELNKVREILKAHSK